MHPPEVLRNKKKKKAQRGATRFPGITQDAKELGVNRSTLYKMLSGYPGFENLHTLRGRYEALKQKQKEKERASA